MKRKIWFRYYNQRLNLGMISIKEVYLLSPIPVVLEPEVYRGSLVYRAKGSAKRISYRQVKDGLVKKRFAVEEEVPDWL